MHASTPHGPLRWTFGRWRFDGSGQNPPEFEALLPEADAACGDHPIRIGSHAIVGGALAACEDTGSFLCWIFSTLDSEDPQTLLSNLSPDESSGISLSIGADRRLQANVGPVTVRSNVEVPRSRWCAVSVSWDGANRAVRFGCGELVSPHAPPSWRWDERSLPADLRFAPGAETLLGAAWRHDRHGDHPGWHYNGKLEAPLLYERCISAEEAEAWSLEPDGVTAPPPGELLAAWDFARDPASKTIPDVAPEFGGSAAGEAFHGVLVNTPARAMTGHAWQGKETDWRSAPREFGAIHFHEDDLTDAAWPEAFSFVVPDLPSGVYSLRLTDASGSVDHLPLFVAPPPNAATARIAFLVPTLSYLAYGNEQLGGARLFPRHDPAASPEAYDYLRQHRLLSLYDVHRDGSGVMYASSQRPIVNLRHDHLTALLDSPHQFPADMHILEWLDTIGEPFDVITDELLHAEGADLLRRYRVVLTGSHPEYWTESMLDGWERYLAGGGRALYLGANGFYWVTSIDESLTCIEIRRVDGTRAWQAGPGEAHHSQTGEPGGLWRMRGRAPHRHVGTGFCAQGFDANRPYRRTERSRDADVAWVFDGVSEEVIGDQPNRVLGTGAAGFEIDRAEPRYGTPPETIVLATADGFSDWYQLTVEEVLASDSRQSGSVNPLVRADMTLTPHPSGGAVFSVSSIAWAGSLNVNGFRNSVAAITRNVLLRFLSSPSPILP